MKWENYKAAGLIIAGLLVFAANVSAAPPGRSDVAAVHGDGFGLWLTHQLFNVDHLLTLVMVAIVVALTGGRALFRRRRPRRSLISS